MAMLGRFITDDRGATSIEYVLIAMLIAMVIIGGITAIGPKINNVLLKAAAPLR